MIRKQFFPLILIMLLSVGIQGANAIQYLEGVNFQSRGTGGYLTFEFDFNATGITWANDIIIFSDFENDNGEFGDLGFDIPTGINVSVSIVNPTSITQSTTFTAIGEYLVYTPEHGMPIQVTGAGNGWIWTSATSVTTMPIEGDELIIISWSNWYVENDTYAEPVSLLPGLINQYLPLGDITGFIISPYTMTMGIMFFPLVFLMFVIPSQQRLGVMMTGIIVLLAWTTFEIALFPEAINLVNLIIRIALAGALVYLFFARRRSIG